LTEQTTPVSFFISDTTASVSGVYFPDYDLDRGDLGGQIEWTAPGDEEQVTYYRVYIAEDAYGRNRSYQGNVSVGDNNFSLLCDTAIEEFTHFVVYTHSSMFEQSTPAPHRFFDASASVINLRFFDRDLDPIDLGGLFLWDPPDPVSITRVTGYYLALADNTNPNNYEREYIGGVYPVGTNQLIFPPDTGNPGAKYFVVFARSHLCEQTTPEWTPIIDRVAIVNNITFPDYDLDEYDLGGVLSWHEPDDTELLTHYMVYFAAGVGAGPSGGVGAQRAFYERTEDGVISLVVPPETRRVQGGWVDDLELPYYNDSNASEVGRSLPSPVDPNATAPVAEDSNETWLNTTTSTTSTVTITFNVTTFTTTTGIIYTHWLVYTASTLCEQTTPTHHLIDDEFSSISSLIFVDKDLDSAELGGLIRWTRPGSVRRTVDYVIYLASGRMGSGRSQVGEIRVAQYIDCRVHDNLAI
jgi:hypothetical protein